MSVQPSFPLPVFPKLVPAYPYLMGERSELTFFFVFSLVRPFSGLPSNREKGHPTDTCSCFFFSYLLSRCTSSSFPWKTRIWNGEDNHGGKDATMDVTGTSNENSSRYTGAVATSMGARSSRIRARPGPAAPSPSEEAPRTARCHLDGLHHLRTLHRLGLNVGLGGSASP